jgi:hypothetical protein
LVLPKECRERLIEATLSSAREKSLEFVQDDHGASAGARKPAKVSSARLFHGPIQEVIPWNDLFSAMDRAAMIF